MRSNTFGAVFLDRLIKPSKYKVTILVRTIHIGILAVFFVTYKALPFSTFKQNWSYTFEIKHQILSWFTTTLAWMPLVENLRLKHYAIYA